MGGNAAGSSLLAQTASGSGLDPDISPAYAALQVARVNAFLGQPSVNTTTLNAALGAAQETAAGLRE